MAPPKEDKKPPITRVQYDRLVDSHRSNLGSHKSAALAAGVKIGQAMHAYTQGYGLAMPAIRTVITKEMSDARAKLAELGSDVDMQKVAQTRKDLAESRSLQGRALRLTRTNAIAAMSISSALLRSGAKLAGRIDTVMANPDWLPTPQEAIDLLKKVAEISKLAGDMNLAAEEAERRILGQPDIVVAHTNMTTDQAVASLSNGAQMLERLKRRAARGDIPEGLSAPVRQALATLDVKLPEDSVH